MYVVSCVRAKGNPEMNAAYRDMSFGEALEKLKTGESVARKGWNGEGMSLFLNPGRVARGREIPDCKVNGLPVSLFQEGNPETTTFMPALCMIAADGSIVTGWLASQTDMLAEDWMMILPLAAELDPRDGA